MKQLIFSILFIIFVGTVSAQENESFYDLRQHNLVNDTLSQGGGPFDWAIAPIKSIESRWMKKGVFSPSNSLSERDLIISNYLDASLANFNVKRDYNLAIARMARRVAPVSDTKVPYATHTGLVSGEVQDGANSLTPVGFVDEYREFGFNADTIKKKIANFGALSAALSINVLRTKLDMYGGMDSILLKTPVMETGSDVSWVNIIGWDDNFDFGNPTKGAWIVQASQNKKHGWFYLPYVQNNTIENVMYFPKYRAYHPKERVHFYDDKGWDTKKTVDDMPLDPLQIPTDSRVKVKYTGVSGAAFGASTYAVAGTKLEFEVWDGDPDVAMPAPILIAKKTEMAHLTGLYMIEFDAKRIVTGDVYVVVTYTNSTPGSFPIPLSSSGTGSNNCFIGLDVFSSVVGLAGYSPTIKLFSADILEVKISTDTIYKTFGEIDAMVYDTLATSKKMYYGDDITIYRERGDSIGTYKIDSFTIKRGELDMLALYDTLVYGSHLTILPKPIKGAISDTTKVYGENDPIFKWAINDTTTIVPMFGRDTTHSGIRKIIVSNAEMDVKIGRKPGIHVGVYPTIDTVKFQTSFADRNNFTATLDAAELTITPKPVTLNVADTIVYGEGFSIGDTINYTYPSFPYDDSLQLKIKTNILLDTGLYIVTDLQTLLSNKFLDTLALDTTKLSNYTVNVAGKLKVNQRPINVAIVDTFTYGDLVTGNNFIYTSTYKNNTTKAGLVAGDSILINLNTFAGKNVGDYVVNNLSDFKLQASGTTKLGNYDTANFAIEAKIHILTKKISLAIDDTITYGDVLSNKQMLHTTNDTVYGDTLYVAGSGFEGLDAGTYNYPAKGNIKDSCNFTLSNHSTNVTGNYTVTNVTGKITVKPKSAKLVVNDTIIYGEAYKVSDTVKYISTDIVTGDSIVLTSKKVSQLKVGEYTIAELNPSNSFLNVIGQTTTKLTNYNLELGGGVVVNKRPIEIAIADTFTYGDLVTGNSFKYTSKYQTKKGLVNADTFKVELNAFANRNVGTYSITTISDFDFIANPGVLSNYDITNIKADIEIKPKDIVLSMRDTLIYGDVYANQSVRGRTNTAYNDVLELKANGFGGYNVGTYNNIVGALNTITPTVKNGLTDVSANYNINPAIKDTLVVVKRKINIVVNDTAVYGDASVGDVLASVANNIVPTDSISIMLGSQMGKDVNDYTVTKNNTTNTSVSGLMSNYEIGTITGNFKITPRPLDVKLSNISKIYGDAVSGTNLMYNVTSGNIIGTDSQKMKFTLSNNFHNPVGTYPITSADVSFEGLKSGNYKIQYPIDADIKITPRIIKVKAKDETIMQWGTEPSLTYQVVSGTLVYGDLPVGDLVRVPGDTIGVYRISEGTLDFGNNYNVEFVDGLFTILERGTITQKIIWDQDLTLVYGETLELTATATSGLPVRYDVLDITMASLMGTTLTGLEIGFVDVIAYQDGNFDYKQATPVRRTVRIVCPEPIVKMENKNLIVCNQDNTGAMVASFDIELFAKRADSILIQFNAKAISDGFVNIKLPAFNGTSVYEVPFPQGTAGEYSAILIPIGVKNCQGNLVEFKFTIAAPSNLIEAKWIDVLTCNNNLATNGGIDGSYYEWYRDGKIIPGESGQYLWAQELKSTYHAVIITTDGSRIPTCPIDIKLLDIPWHGYEEEEITLTPNPSTRGSLSKMTISRISDEELESAVIEIYTLSGRKVDTVKPTSSSIFVYMPKDPGSYLVVLTTKWRKRDFRIVVD